MSEKPIIFINTNNKQLLGALIAMYSMKKKSMYADEFEVKLNRFEETFHLLNREGHTYLRKGRQAVWHNDDLQSWSPIRRRVPQLMAFKGRALVTDPDVFAVGDVFELLSQDMQGKGILCRNVSEGYKANGNSFYASSVMLLDCSLLTHWKWEEEIDQMFRGELDYGPWIGLKGEDSDIIGEIGEEWNSFDKLTPQTKLLHTTERVTQPWKTGLPVDFDLNITSKRVDAPSSSSSENASFWGHWLRLFKKNKTNDTPCEKKYLPHPDPAQERFFFTLVRGALEDGFIDEGFLKNQMTQNNLRHDAFRVLASLGYQAKSS